MIISIICFILILGTIVLVHEFGHFFFAKLFGIYVYEFSIGMGPKIFSKKDKKGETSYSIRAIPVGGFVQLAGEGLDEDSKLPKDRLLQSKPIWQRFLVMFFGAGNNFILAIVVLFFLGLIVGSPNNSTVIPSVIEGSPAYTAGLQAGDKVTSINGDRTKTLDDLQLYLTIAQGETSIEVLRDKERKTFVVTPLAGEEAEKAGYSYGITFDSELQHGFVNAVKYAFTKTWALIRQLVITLKELLPGGNVGLNDLSGPLGIYQAVDQTKSSGISNLFYLLALLCINVGFINLIPFPAFDGGRILFLLIEKIKGSPIKPETENLIHNIGFICLLVLILVVTFFDVFRMIGFDIIKFFSNIFK